MAKWDVIVIGAGPNGLTAAAYLAKAGLKTLVIEKRYEIGGGLWTEEIVHPSFLTNSHAVYMFMVEYAPPYTDLKLQEEYDLEHIYPKLQVAMPLSDGRCICLYSDIEKTAKSIEKISPKDANTYRKMAPKFQEYTDAFLAPATYVPPEPALEHLVKLNQTPLGTAIMEYNTKSPQAIIEELFENTHVKALMLYLACHWGLEYDVEGVGYLVPLYLNRWTHMRLVRGGSHVTAQALAKALIANGGMTWTAQRIKRIVLKNGVATGVEMSDGRIVEANKAVISTLDPIQTFMELVGKPSLNKDFVEKLNLWKWDSWSLLGVHLALREAPQFKAAASDPEINKAFMYVLGYETMDSVIWHFEEMRKGELSKGAGINACFPTVHDPSQCRPGYHTGVLSQMAPYGLKRGAEQWYRVKDEMAKDCLATLARYAPNINKEKVIAMPHVVTPVDIENRFSDMVRGSLKQGAYHPLQMGYNRPNDECSLYRTPIKSLYLGGSSTHPGGLVTFGAGYNVANAVAEDLGVKKWWGEPPSVTNSRKLGLL